MQQFVNQIRYSVRAEGDCRLLTNYDTVTLPLLVMAGQGVRLKVSAEYVCGGQYSGQTGSITSPLYPQNYVNSMACIYDIVAPKHQKLLLTCSEFRLSKRGGDRTKFQVCFSLINNFHQT